MYHTLKYGKQYIEQGENNYKTKLEEREKALIMKLAKKHNMQVSHAS